MKKFLSLLLTLSLTLTLFPATLALGERDLAAVQAYAAAHPGELEGMSDQELLARKGNQLTIPTVEEYRKKCNLTEEEVRSYLLVGYVTNRLRVEAICAEVETYKRLYPGLWDNFDPHVWFVQGNSAWWDEETYWRVNGLQSEEEFTALLFGEYMQTGVWQNYVESLTGPHSPSWVEEEDYLVFPGDPVYEPENWQRILALRWQAESGALLPQEGRDWAEGSPGECYETALVRLKYAENTSGAAVAAELRKTSVETGGVPEAMEEAVKRGKAAPEVGQALLSAGKAFSAAESGWIDQNRGKDALAYRLAIEKYRAYLAYHPAYVDDWGRGVIPALDALGMPVEKFFDTPFMDRLSTADRAAVEQSIYDYWEFYLEQRNLISVYLDGAVLLMDTLPQVREQRTMVPVRAVAEALGADVEWAAQSGQITMTRAGKTVVMVLGSTVAMVDGKPVKMDVAPYADQNRTYIPVRYVSEFFGQTVSWDQNSRRVDICEDKSAWADTDVEAWAKPMGALLILFSGGDPSTFGGWPRAAHPNGRNTVLVEPVGLCREKLKEWEINSREELLKALEEARAGVNNEAFVENARKVKDMTAAQAKAYARGNEVDKYMWPQTRALWKKWGGEKGIAAWDLCRSSALAQWGYTAGYLTYGEAMDAVSASTRELGKTFSSWDEVYENFADGYYWCAREDMTDTGVWESDFGMTYQAMKATLELKEIFDDSLFAIGVQDRG